MSERSVDEFGKLISSAKKVFIGRNENGQHKIKLKTGPFGLVTKRYVVDSETMELLRLKFGLSRN